MKKIKALILLFLVAIYLPVKAQNTDSIKVKPKMPNYISKGDFSASISFARTKTNVIQKNIYDVLGSEASALYYFANRLGLETAISGHRYDLLLNRNPEAKFVDKKYLLLVSERLRYNFYDKSHCATAFIQTGYSFGQFSIQNFDKLHRWEIASLGLRSSFLRQFFPNLDFEAVYGIAKDNLHENLMQQYKIGLSCTFNKTGIN